MTHLLSYHGINHNHPTAFNMNKAHCFIHLFSSCSCRAVGQSCCHHEHQEEDLDKLYHNQLTKWSTFSGQMRHSSPAAAVIHHTPGDKCWITIHPVWKGKNTDSPEDLDVSKYLTHFGHMGGRGLSSVKLIWRTHIHPTVTEQHYYSFDLELRVYWLGECAAFALLRVIVNCVCLDFF